jgi:DNA-directed RNA polymerase specialized sigma24 family protein
MSDAARDPEEDDDEPVEGDDPTAPPLGPEVVKRFLGGKDAHRIALAAVRPIVPHDRVDDLAADAMVRALTARPPSLEKVLPAWLDAIARRVAIRWLEKRARRAKYEGAMPQQVAREDDYTGETLDDADDQGDFDPTYDPDADGEPGELLGPYLDRLIGDHGRDRETRAMLREHAEEQKSFAAIATARGLSPAQVANRVLRFKKKYGRAVKRRRTLMLMLRMAGGLVLAGALALLVWWLLHRTRDILPDPERSEPRSTPSASASAPYFLQALPPGPDPVRPAPLPKAPLPKAPLPGAPAP